MSRWNTNDVELEFTVSSNQVSLEFNLEGISDLYVDSSINTDEDESI